MTSPKISIIIPTWNTANITKKCVDTIQKYLPPNFAQIIIVDNSSTDNTAKVFSSIKSITYCHLDSNIGYGQACNYGANIANAPYLLFLNSDMELIDDSLIKMLEFIKKTPECGLIGPKFLNTDKSIQASVFPPQTIINAFKEYFLHKNSYSKFTPTSNLPQPVWAVSGGAILIQKTIFNQIGGWDKRYFMYFEDMELCRQTRNLNLNVYYYPLCAFIHHHGASGAKLADSQNQWRRLIPGSIQYHGYLNHYLINSVIWWSQKLKR